MAQVRAAAMAGFIAHKRTMTPVPSAIPKVPRSSRSLTAGIHTRRWQTASVDPLTWRRTALKFQAHQAELLIGAWPEAADVYRARAVMGNVEAINVPVLLLHGQQDQVTKVSDSVALADALGDRAQLAVFPGEGILCAHLKRCVGRLSWNSTSCV